MSAPGVLAVMDAVVVTAENNPHGLRAGDRITYVMGQPGTLESQEDEFWWVQFDEDEAGHLWRIPYYHCYPFEPVLKGAVGNREANLKRSEAVEKRS